jgi:hypothetical protein
MARFLITLALAALLAGCSGTLGTILYVQSGQVATLTVGPPSAAASAAK